MKRTNNPTSASKNEDLDRIVAELDRTCCASFTGLQAHRGRSLQACEGTDARLHERQHPLR